jgi:hypothetical protein
MKSNLLFHEISPHDAANIYGGGLFDFAVFSLLAIQPYSFGGTEYTIEEFILAVIILFKDL